MLNTIPIIIPKTPGLLTRKEFRAYLNVGTNEIPRIVERFGLEPVGRDFPLRSVWRQIMGIEPVDAVQEMFLRQQLQDIDWVRRQVGLPPSTVRRKVREGSFGYPAPIVNLGNPMVNARLRRWIPEQILARKRGDEIPVFRPVAPFRRAAAQQKPPSCRQEAVANGPTNNAFAEMIRSNARSSS